MAHYEYSPKGTCSTRMIFFFIFDDREESLQVIGGCNGNLKGIGALIRGMKTEDVINRLEGIRCGFKPTSCPDQIAEALKSYKQ